MYTVEPSRSPSSLVNNPSSFLRRSLLLLIAAVLVAVALLGVVGVVVHGEDTTDDAFFDRRVLGTGADPTQGLTVGDMNNDGALDLVVGNRDSQDLVYLNDGFGYFDWESSERLFGDSETQTKALVAADINNDGALDIIAGRKEENNVVYLNDGFGRFDWSGSEQPFGSNDETVSLAVGDVNGDGMYDIVIGNGGAKDSRINYLFLNDGSGHFFQGEPNCANPDPLVQCLGQNEHTTAVALAYVNSDNTLDIVVGNYGEQNWIYFNDGNGDFSEPAARVGFGSGDEETTSIGLGDMDGDGDFDIVVGNTHSTDDNVLYLNDGAGGFAQSRIIGPANDETNSIAIGDLNGDGALDIAVGNGRIPSPDRWEAEASVVYLNDGNGFFYDTEETVDCGQSPQNARCFSAKTFDTQVVVLADLDSNGLLDIIAGNDRQSNIIYLNTDGFGTFALLGEQSFGDANRDSRAVAVADLNGDEALDLVVGNWKTENVVLLNDGNGTFYGGQISCSSPPHDVFCFGDVQGQTQAIAVGDLDGDGALDIVAANEGEANIIYLNTGGSAFTWLNDPQLFGTSKDGTRDVVLGDMNGDGPIDIVVVNDDGAMNMVFYNDGAAQFAADTVKCDNPPAFVQCFGGGANDTHAVAVGDLNNDYSLDIVIGDDGGQNMVFINDGLGNFDWPGSQRHFGEYQDRSHSISLGDVNGDGALDIAVGNWGTGEERLAHANLVYLNDGNGNFPGQSDSRYFGTFSDNTGQIRIRDLNGDGYTDIISANKSEPNIIYMNDGQGNFDWFGAGRVFDSEDANTYDIAIGDLNGDGTPDLVAANNGQNKLVLNGFRRQHRLVNSMPQISISRPVDTANADYYSSPTILHTSSIPIIYHLSDIEGDPIGRIKAYYSLDGGGLWLPAIPSADTETEELATNQEHLFIWNTFASAFFGQSDNVIFRIDATPSKRPQSYLAPSPKQWSLVTASTFPFRVQGTQVRVYTDTVAAGNELAGAQVYRLPATAVSSGAKIGTETNTQGDLIGSGTLAIGDRLAALYPVTVTDSFVAYNTSAAPIMSGLDMYTVTVPGVQPLFVSADNTLLAFNLDISLEWDATEDNAFMDQLQFDLQRVSELLYDWTNGQTTLGDVNVYHNREQWLDAHVRIYASNRLRPWAAQGGIVSAEQQDPDLAEIRYLPGQIAMGSVWNRYGTTQDDFGEDWPRTLAHELGHYLFFLDDNYLGLDENGLLVPIDGCVGAMSDPYLSGNSEFHPDTGWLPECQDTLSHRSSGRSDWATIETFYPQLQVPTGDITEVNPGPSSLPLALTHIQVHEPHASSGVLSAPYFYLVDEYGSRVQPGNGARSILYQGDKLIDLGRPTQDRILARGAAVGDRLCLYDLDVGQLGCKLVTPYDEQLTLWSYPDWQPEITVSPVTSRTIDISVANVPSGLPLHAKLYPINDPAPDVIVLTETTSSYTGTFNTTEPALNGYIQVWVDESEPRQESVTDYTIGGAPGYQRGGGGYQRGGGGYQRGGGAPAVSTDGQAILFGEGLVFDEGEFVALQTATVLPNVPAWATVAGDAYRLVMSDAAPDLTGSSLSVSYLEREVPADEEMWLKLYFWNGTTWQPLQTTLDTYHNFASAAVQGEGLYVLMSGIELPLYGPGWDSFGYPIQETRLVSVALSSINGSYTMVYGRDPEDDDEWKVYGPDAPDHVNDLKVLEYGRSYWIYLTESVDLKLRGTAVANASAIDSILRPPATYYGTIVTEPGFEPAIGTEVTAWVKGNLCGKAKTVVWNEQVVYSINVLAFGENGAQDCGLPGNEIAFRVGSIPMLTTAMWDDTRLWEVPLSVDTAVYLYLPLTFK